MTLACATRMHRSATIVIDPTRAGRPERTKAFREHLRDRGDEIDPIDRNERQHRARAENEHQRDDGRRDHDRPCDDPFRFLALTSVNRDVFEPAECAESHFRGDVEAEDRHHRHRDRRAD